MQTCEYSFSSERILSPAFISSKFFSSFPKTPISSPFCPSLNLCFLFFSMNFRNSLWNTQEMFGRARYFEGAKETRQIRKHKINNKKPLSANLLLHYWRTMGLCNTGLWSIKVSFLFSFRSALLCCHASRLCKFRFVCLFLVWKDKLVTPTYRFPEANEQNLETFRWDTFTPFWQHPKERRLCCVFISYKKELSLMNSS